jgi:hypothetical protein
MNACADRWGSPRDRRADPNPKFEDYSQRLQNVPIRKTCRNFEHLFSLKKTVILTIRKPLY